MDGQLCRLVRLPIYSSGIKEATSLQSRYQELYLISEGLYAEQVIKHGDHHVKLHIAVIAVNRMYSAGLHSLIERVGLVLSRRRCWKAGPKYCTGRRKGSRDRTTNENTTQPSMRSTIFRRHS